MTAAFDKLARPVQKWIRSQGWRELRDIQARAIHVVCDSNSDLIIAASTAGGKTEAAFLPLISQIIDSPTDRSGFDLLYVSPLKALISDQCRRLEDICRDMELTVTPWHGDVPGSVKSRAIKSPAGILLITPESLEALFIRRGIDIPRLFDATRAIVIDELHSMLDSERGVQMRSLIARLELAINRSVRKLGLSATLGDMALAQAYLNPDHTEAVSLIEAKGGSSELQLQVRGYLSGDEEEGVTAAMKAISQHLFQYLRGSDNLAFAGSRRSVETYSDCLRQLCESEHLPQEFYPHHASLSREHREFVEKRIKAGNLPTTVICTSTLELGIDIGEVACVAQIGAPFSVASLRQRLGRSGRREGIPSVLRQYVVEAELDSHSNFADRLRLGLVRAVAAIELLLEGWCEPPEKDAMHLSTLVHQILSVIAERGGARPHTLFKMLCEKGPFRQVDRETFLEVLRSIGREDIDLIEQAEDGLLLLGARGEKLVEHYSFYAVFQTPEEYRIVSDGKELGTLPIEYMISRGMLLIFSGRRWEVIEVDDRDRVIIVMPSKAGVPPIFGGDPGIIHDRVIARMFELLESEAIPIYMDSSSLELLAEARRHFKQLKFSTGRIAQMGEQSFVVATRCGSVKTATLALALRSAGFAVHPHDGFIEVVKKDGTPPFIETVETLAKGESVNLFSHSPNLVFEKYHPYLTDELLQADALSARLDLNALPSVCRQILEMV